MLNDFIHTKFDNPFQNKGKYYSLDKAKGKKNSDDSLEENENTVVLRKNDNKELKTEPKTEPETEIEHTPNHTGLHLTDTLKEKFQEFIGHFDHVPAFLKDNPFIHTGYRINFHTSKKVLRSLFMIHNESVNIWTHLGGAIVLIIMCVVLSFSVNNFDAQNIKQFVQTEVADLFEPIYSHLPDFSKIEHDFSEKFNSAKEDITKFGENTLISLENKLEAISTEIENVKEDINPEAIGRLLNKLKGQLESIPDSLAAIKDSVSQELITKEKLNTLTQDLKKKVEGLQNKLLQKIDSQEMDWIDIYKYVNPNYSSSPAFKEGYRKMPLSRWPIIVFLLSAVFCLLCSAIFHLFYCLSHRANQILLRLDYAGVSILITGSCFPPFVYGFYCQPIWSQIYLSIIGITSIIVFFVSLGDKIHSEPYRTHKSVMYGALGLLAGLPMLHLVYNTVTAVEPHDNLDFVPSFPYYVTMGIAYLGGLTVYATKVPERYCPGKFDIWGHSHQIWHCAVLAGIVFTYFGAFDNYYTRQKLPCIGCEL